MSILGDSMMKKILRQPVVKELLAFVTVSMCFFLQGFTFTYNAFINVGEDGVTAEQASVSGSLNFLTMFLGSILIAKIMNKYGRKKAIQYVYIIYTIAGGIILFYNEERYYLFYISRIFSGFGNSSLPVALLYVSEVCHKSRRGIFAGSFSVVFLTGFSISYTLQYYCHLNVLGFFCGIFASTFLLMSCIIPETKYWYIMKNRQEDAERSSLWFDCNQTQKEIYAEFDEIVYEASDGEDTNIFTYLRQWPHFKKFLVCQMLFFSRALCGRSPTAIFPDYYYSSFHLIYDAKKVTLGGVLFEFLFSILASFLVGRLNRRTTLFFCISTSILVLSFMTVFNIFIDQMNEFCPWLEVICLYLYSSILLSFISPLVNLVVVETVSLSNKRRASMLTFSMSFVSLYISVTAFIFPFSVEKFGIAFPLAYFMFGNIVLLVTVLFFLPETNNKALFECGQEKLVLDDTAKRLHQRF